MKIKRCESCGETEGLIDLHESFCIEGFTYRFNEFYFLCRNCHMGHVHYFQCHQCELLGPRASEFISSFWRRNPKIKQFGLIKSENKFKDAVMSRFDTTVRFVLSDNIDVDYSNLQIHNLNHLIYREKCQSLYVHLDSKLRYLMWMKNSFRSMNKQNELVKLIMEEDAKYARFFKLRFIDRIDRDNRILKYARLRTKYEKMLLELVQISKDIENELAYNRLI